jgi:hypothetical protein
MPITETQQTLIDAIARALSADPAIDAAWLAGSLGAGGGDAFSDVDVLVLAGAGKAGDTALHYASAHRDIAESVLVNTVAGRVISVVTSDWRRFDLTFVNDADLIRYDRAKLTALFNKTGAEPPSPPTALYQTSPAALNQIVCEFFRVMGLTVVGMGRKEYILGLSGMELLRQMTINLMLEENAISPAARGGALHRNPLLTADQRAQLDALSPVAASHAGILAAQNEIAAIFLPRARRLAAQIGMEWPAALETATRRHLQNNLNVTLPT